VKVVYIFFQKQSTDGDTLKLIKRVGFQYFFFLLLLTAVHVSVISTPLINGPIIHKGYFQLCSVPPHGNTNTVLALPGGSSAGKV